MGIPLGSNFSVQTALPLDDRTVVADLTARDAIVAGKRYEGLTVYVESELKSYQLQGGILNANWAEAGGGGFDDTVYARSGFSARFGEAFDTADLGATIDQILNLSYLAPLVSLSASGSGTVREKGDSVASTTLTATTTKRSDDIATVEFFRGGVSIDVNTPPANPGGGSEVHVDSSAPFSDNLTFRVDVTDNGATGGPSTVSSSRTFNFVYPYYYGIGAAGLTPAQVAALTKDVRTENTNYDRSFGAATSQVYYFAYPASYGALTSILDENGFEVFGDWTETIANITGLDTNAVSYRIYEFNNVVTAPATNYVFKQ